MISNIQFIKMKTVIVGFFIVLGSFLGAQQTHEKIEIPFTCNAKVDQYMADFQILVESSKGILTYGKKEEVLKKIGEDYVQFSQKYSNISKEIRTLDHGLQKLVAEYTNAKTTELTSLIRK